MIRNFNHAMSSGISIGTGAESDVWRERGERGCQPGILENYCSRAVLAQYHQNV